MMTKSVLQAADKLLLESGIKSLPLELQALKSIAKKMGWVLKKYQSAYELIEDMGLLGYAKRHSAFAVVYHGEKIILFDGKLPYEEKIRCICHEMGHLALEHIEDSRIIGHSNDDEIQLRQEQEAEAFAAELLAPVCVLVQSGITTYSELLETRLLTEVQAAEHIKNIPAELPPYSEIEIALCKQMIPSKHKSYIKSLIVLAAMVVILMISKAIADSIRYMSVPDDIIESKNPYEIVYITHSGERYHRENCYYIENKDVISTTIEDAEKAGYTPCQICF